MAARRPTDSGDTVEKARRGLATRAVKLALQTFAKIAVPMVIRMDSTRRTSMFTRSSLRISLSIVITMLAVLTALPAAATCCPDDGNGITKSATGLGQAAPNAIDLVADPAWQLYEFQRGGVRYLQVNDAAGKVRAAVGRIDDLIWVLPVGVDVERVSVPGDSLPLGRGALLYHSSDIDVLHYVDVNGDRWVFRIPSSP